MKKNFIVEKTAEQLEEVEKAKTVEAPLPSVSETYSKIIKSRKGSFSIFDFW